MIHDIFRREHVGQPVHTQAYGNGVITCCHSDGSAYIIEVKFEDVITKLFMQDGRHFSDQLPTLSFGHKEPKPFVYGSPTPLYKPVEFDGTPVWCWVGESVEETLENKYLCMVVAKNRLGYLAVKDGLSNTDSIEVAEWKCVMLPVPHSEDMANDT